MSATSTECVVHPLVLLSVADHYNRVASNTQRRVVGVLLGSRTRNKVDITNSFAVPFEEDLKDPSVWFLDHNFLETMFWMFKKVNSKFSSLPASGSQFLLSLTHSKILLTRAQTERRSWAFTAADPSSRRTT